jgi:hypothetical protein
MLKRFTVWMEDRFKQRQLTHRMLQKLGYDVHALDDQDVILTDRKYNDIQNAIVGLEIDDENKENMIRFVQNHRDKDGNIQNLSLKALAAKIKYKDIETQDTASSTPAVLPQGQQPAPKPMSQQMQQQNQPMAAGSGPMF